MTGSGSQRAECDFQCANLLDPSRHVYIRQVAQMLLIMIPAPELQPGQPQSPCQESVMAAIEGLINGGRDRDWHIGTGTHRATLDATSTTSTY